MLRKIYEGTRRVVFPHFCFVCRGEGGLVCDECMQEETTALLKKGAKHHVSAVNPAIACITLASYEAPMLKQLLHAYKYQGIDEAGDLLEQVFSKLFLGVQAMIHPGSLVVPMPLHALKERMRGFNQCTRFAERVAYTCRGFFAPTILQKRFTWHAQASMENAEARVKNARGAFFCALPAQVRDKNIVLIDDVFTTGATAQEAAQTLCAAGAKTVLILAFLEG